MTEITKCSGRPRPAPGSDVRARTNAADGVVDDGFSAMNQDEREIGFIRTRMLEDLANTSDEEIMNEYLEAGQDMAAIAKQTHDALREVVAASMRRTLK